MVPIFVPCLARVFDGERRTSQSALKRTDWLVLTVSNKPSFSIAVFILHYVTRHPYILRRNARRVSIDFYGTFHSSFSSLFFPSPFSTAGSVALAIITPVLSLYFQDEARVTIIQRISLLFPRYIILRLHSVFYFFFAVTPA